MTTHLKYIQTIIYVCIYVCMFEYMYFLSSFYLATQLSSIYPLSTIYLSLTYSLSIYLNILSFYLSIYHLSKSRTFNRLIQKSFRINDSFYGNTKVHSKLQLIKWKCSITERIERLYEAFFLY